MKFLVASFLFLTFSLAQAEPLSPSELSALLERIRGKRAGAPQVQADFSEEKNVRLMNKPITSSGKVWFQAPNKFRREVEGSTPSITVSNGSDLWIYYPKFKSAERYQLGRRSPLEAAIATLNASLNLENVEQNYRISGEKTAEGGYRLMLLPRAGSIRRFVEKFHLELDPALEVKRTEMIQPKGDRIVTTYRNESRAPIPAERFEFVPPAGTEVTTPLGK